MCWARRRSGWQALPAPRWIRICISRPANMRQIWQAKAVCAGCPVLAQCREYGMTEPHGVWGGLSAGERREIRAREIDHQHELARHAAVQLDHEYGRAA